MPAGEASADEVRTGELDYGRSEENVIEEGDVEDIDEAPSQVVSRNERVVMSALERVVPWTTSEPSSANAAPVSIIDEDLVPDTLNELTVATRLASS